MKIISRFLVQFAFLLFSATLCGQDYSIIFLGDTHYDEDSKRLHPTDNPKDKAKASDVEMWKERLPELLTAAGKQIDAKTVFVIQGGDLVEGGTFTAGAHKNMLEDGYKKVQSYFSIPLLTVRGNHDVSGRAFRPAITGAYKNFAAEYVIPAIQRVEGIRDLTVDPPGINIAFRYGKDLYILVDFNRGLANAAFLKNILEKNADARYKILITHSAPVPWNTSARPEWRLYGNKDITPEKRNAMIELFQKYNCIFLAGHTHRIGYLKYSTEKGAIYQVMNNCVRVPQTPPEPVPQDSDLSGYGTKIMQSRYPSAAYTKELAEYFKPGIKSYYYARGAGYMILNISDQHITVKYFHGASETPSFTLTIPENE